MTNSKVDTLITTLQRLELELLSDADAVSTEALPELERALENLKGTLRLQYRNAPRGERETELRERLRMQRALEMLRRLPPAQPRSPYADQCFTFAELVNVAESVACSFSGNAAS